MGRVTATDVKAIIETSLTDPQIEAIIVSANIFITNIFGTGTTDILKEIERWVSAHMIAISWERQAKKEGAGGASVEYTGTYTEGLKSTSYGQTAISLDTTGKLDALGKQVAGMWAIASPKY